MRCPILFCAASRGIAFCLRDCPRYPCHLFTAHWIPCMPRTEGLHLSERARGTRPGNGEEAWPILRIFCLGRFRVVRWDGEIKDPEWGQGKGASRRMKHFLAYLVHHGSRGVSKDQLLSFLWPDTADPARLSNRFYSTLSYLRRTLDPSRRPWVGSPLIVHEDGWCRLEQTGCWIDVEAFERYFQEAQRLEQSGYPEAARDFWQMAVALYHGDYLEDLASAWPRWDEDEHYQWRRGQLREMYFVAVIKLATDAERRGDHTGALKLAQHVLQLDSTREDAFLVLLRALARLGRRDALVRHYRQFSQALRDLLGLDPSPETVALYRKLVREGLRTTREMDQGE